MNEKQIAYAQLHLCVLIWGFTAIFGGLISLQAVPLVWWRVALSCAVLPLLMPLAQLRGLSRKVILQMFGIGLLVGAHWLSFYGAIKLSNASVGVVTMATTSFFAAFTEPLFMKTKFKWYELALGLLVLPGMWMVVENLDFSMRAGLFLGLFGAFLCAIFSVLNKKMIERHDPPPLAMSFVELGAIVILCSVLMPFVLWFLPGQAFLPQGWDWLWLVILAWVCTVLPWFLTLKAFRHISAFYVNLSLNLEPVYGVLLAGLILNEHQTLKPGFYWGVAIILVAVFSHPFLKSKFEKKA